MKPTKNLINCTLALGLTMCANAAVSLVGVDSSTAANWRTGAALEADGQYGTSGYVVYGLNVADSIYTQPFDISDSNASNAYALPAGITVTTADTNIGMWSGNGNFGTMEDPTDGNTIASTPVLANSGGPKQFTISRSLGTNIRVTFMTASGDGQSTNYSLTVDDGSGPVSSSYTHAVDGLAYHVFDISGGTSDIVVDIVSTAENRSLTGIAFDAVPEPSITMFAALGGLSFLLRRRRC